MTNNVMGWLCRTYGGDENCMQGFVGKLRERGHLEDPDIVRRILLKWIFKKWEVTGLIWLRKGTCGGLL